MSSRSDGFMGLYIGNSRSGKSTAVKKVVAQHSRVLAYDPKGEYAAMGFTMVETRLDLFNALKQATGSAKIAFIANSRKDFEFWCDCAFNWNRQKEALIVAEELANVTNAGKAADNWGRLVNQGLGLGLMLLATAQRGAEIDKGVMNNATYLHIAQHQTDDDASYIAKKIGVDIGEIPREPLRFVVWRGGRGLLIRGGSINYKSKEDRNPVLKGIKHGSNRVVPLKIEKDGRFKGVAY